MPHSTSNCSMNSAFPVQPLLPAPYQTSHVYNQFVITCDRRDELRQWLAENQIGSEIYYPLSLHLQACFRNLNYHEGDLSR